MPNQFLQPLLLPFTMSLIFIGSKTWFQFSAPSSTYQFHISALKALHIQRYYFGNSCNLAIIRKGKMKITRERNVWIVYTLESLFLAISIHTILSFFSLPPGTLTYRLYLTLFLGIKYFDKSPVLLRKMNDPSSGTEREKTFNQLTTYEFSVFIRAMNIAKLFNQYQ